MASCFSASLRPGLRCRRRSAELDREHHGILLFRVSSSWSSLSSSFGPRESILAELWTCSLLILLQAGSKNQAKNELPGKISHTAVISSKLCCDCALSSA